FSRDWSSDVCSSDLAAREFMQALMPSDVDRVIHYKDPTAHLFPRYGVESQLDALHSHTVRLRSGGYIVLNATEALVAIDVNSGQIGRASCRAGGWIS